MLPQNGIRQIQTLENLQIFFTPNIADQHGGFVCMHTGGVNADDRQC